ncbi:hypothetical protein [Actinoplanes couchii]|uniref:PH domain-containing protein n=1 Tax=Actinoplanes couchii TaxID=403638 RepID=A0ABQ3XRB8_9ACTN|nr:hypothetical protein [Actinoplanes couchii]MDR6320020.1 Ca2+/Na+ antiporter [Actinoplanes couchii]GID61059.1 hypothetical protein Aco03nite_094630 [Actinoplanes couchii]
MILRRSVGSRVLPAVVAASMTGFAGFLVSRQFQADGSVSGWLLVGAMSLFALLMAASMLWYALQRFQVGVDRDGWTVRIGSYRHDLRWAEILAVVIENRVIEGRDHRMVPALYLVPESSVSVGVPNDLRATVDGRPAVRLFDLDEPRIEEEQFLREIASLAGDRLEVRVHRLSRLLGGEDVPEQLNGGEALPAFPPGAEGVRTQRWLNRRRFLLFVGWYLLVVVPTLLLTGFAARLHELFGAAVAVLGLLVVVAAYAQFVSLFSHATDLVDAEVAISGTGLVRVIGDRTFRDDMHAGKAVVLPPGAKRNYGKAWLLGFPHAVVLLGDPRTGRLRSPHDLRALSTVMRDSPHDADRAAARDLDSLTVQSQVGDPSEPGGAENAHLWISMTKAGRILAWAVVVGSVLLAGGWMLETTRYLGGAVILISVALATVWAAYALYRIVSLFSAAWQAARKGGDHSGGENPRHR